MLGWDFRLGDRSHTGIDLRSQHLSERRIKHTLWQACDMLWDRFADEKLHEVVTEVIALLRLLACGQGRIDREGMSIRYEQTSHSFQLCTLP